MHPIAEQAESGTESIESLVEQFYSATGPLAAQGWDVRPQQRQMSLDIARAYDARQGDRAAPAWTLHEAPTGTGKGLAYLVPGLLITLREQALWRAKPAEDRKGPPPQLVVSTANIALQDQLLRKDIPAVGEMLDFDVRATLLKGRNNYVCRREIATSGSLLGDDDFGRLMRELEAGWDGDRESLTWDPGNLWPKVSRMSQDCTGVGCPHYPVSASGDGGAGWCYWRQAIHGWNHGHVSIVNHHLLAVQGGLNACLLAVDEMHQMEGAIQSAVAEKLTAGSGTMLAQRAARWLGADEAKALIEAPVHEVMDALREQFVALNPRAPRYPEPFVLRQGWAPHLAGCFDRVKAAYNEIAKEARANGCFEISPGRFRPPAPTGDDESEGAKLATLATALHNLAGRVLAFADGQPSDEWEGHPWALYVEGFFRDGAPVISARAVPADVSWAVRAMQQTYPVAAFTSATVPLSASLRLTFGMPAVGEDHRSFQTYPWRTEAKLPSPYDLANAGVLVVPQGPSPKDHEWQDWATYTVVECVQQSRGGALVLASSISQMQRYGKALREWLDTPVKVQGDEGRANLRAWFRDNVDATLVGTRSFFEGLDVQGESLRLVIIDRIPFARPGDPVEDAIQALLVERNGGGSPYMLRSVPQAAMIMAQGAGRLIRSASDRGAVVVLDRRLTSPGEGWGQIRAAMPAFPLSMDKTDVGNLLDGKPLQGLPKVQGRTAGMRWS